MVFVNAVLLLLLSFGYNPAPYVKKKKKKSPHFIYSSLYTGMFSFIGTRGRQQDIDCELSYRGLCE